MTDTLVFYEGQPRGAWDVINELKAALAEARASRERLRIVLAAIDDSDLDIVTFDTMWALLLPADLEPYK